jgi:LmbE family N-acetylglucosaminyl deacetylase
MLRSLLFAMLLAPSALAQITPLALDEGATGLGLAMRRLPVSGRVLYVTAHPDDENNGVLVALRRGRGLETALLTVTRGDGGQNEIGPELFQAIGILRTEELMALHRYDGARQFFTSAYEFGYSFSVEETFEKWGREEILRDVVRTVRLFRPDVILTLSLEAPGGGQHHQAAAQLARDAFRAAADPGRFADQIQQGLRPWQARKIYQGGTGGGPMEGRQPPPGPSLTMSTADYDPLTGMSHHQLGMLSRTMHK